MTAAPVTLTFALSILASSLVTFLLARWRYSTPRTRKLLAEYRRIAEAHTVEWRGWPTAPTGAWISVCANVGVDGTAKECMAYLDDLIERAKLGTHDARLRVRVILAGDDRSTYEANRDLDRTTQGPVLQCRNNYLRVLSQYRVYNGDERDTVVRMVITLDKWDILDPPVKPEVRFIEVPVAIPTFLRDDGTAELQDEAARIAAWLDVDEELRSEVARLRAKERAS